MTIAELASYLEIDPSKFDLAAAIPDIIGSDLSLDQEDDHDMIWELVAPHALEPD